MIWEWGKAKKKNKKYFFYSILQHYLDNKTLCATCPHSTKENRNPPRNSTEDRSPPSCPKHYNCIVGLESYHISHITQQEMKTKESDKMAVSLWS